MPTFDRAFHNFAAARGAPALAHAPLPVLAPPVAPPPPPHPDADDVLNRELRERMHEDYHYCKSMLAELLMESRALGLLSAVMVQQICQAAVDDGLENAMVQKLASVANQGWSRHRTP